MTTIEQLADAIFSFLPEKSKEGILPHALALRKERLRKTLVGALSKFREEIIAEIEKTKESA